MASKMETAGSKAMRGKLSSMYVMGSSFGAPFLGPLTFGHTMAYRLIPTVGFEGLKKYRFGLLDVTLTENHGK